jgi:hypothetical protein
MILVHVEELAARVRGIADPVLHGKVSKALSLLQRALALYRYTCKSLPAVVTIAFFSEHHMR